MTKTSKYLMLAASVLLLTVQSNFAVAQDSPQLKEHQKSVALIDLRVDQLIKEAIAVGIKKESIDQIKFDGPFTDVKPSEIERVFGAFSFPENLEAARVLIDGGPASDGLPFEFFLKIKFANADSLERMQSFFVEQFQTVTLSDGKEYLTKLKAPEKELFFARRIDETTFELGSKAYLVQPNRDFSTDRLTNAFASAPKESLRLVVDLETPREFLQQAAKLAKSKLDPVSSAYLDLIDNAKSLVITSSLSSENLLSMIAEANNDSDAEELAEGIDGLVGTARLGFGTLHGMLAPEMKEPLRMAKGIFDSLAPAQSGSTVKLLVKHPKGLIAEMIKLRRAAEKIMLLNDFKQIAFAVIGFQVTNNNKLPFAIESESAISWRAKILPELADPKLNLMYEKIDFGKGANEAPNSQFAKQMPRRFGIGGSNTAVSWIKSAVNDYDDITDDPSNTIMLIENPNGGPWLENNPLTIDDAVKLVTGLGDGQELTIALYDGSSLSISNRIPEKDLRALFDPRDGNPVDDSWRRK